MENITKAFKICMFVFVLCFAALAIMSLNDIHCWTLCNVLFMVGISSFIFAISLFAFCREAFE